MIVKDSLEDKWKNFSLMEKENKQIELDIGNLTKVTTKGERNIVGKIYSNHLISKEVIRSTMAKIWKVRKSFYFQDISPNLYVIIFENEVDK